MPETTKQTRSWPSRAFFRLCFGLGLFALLVYCSEKSSFDGGVTKGSRMLGGELPSYDVDVSENRKLGDPIIDFTNDSAFSGGFDTVQLRNTSDQSFWIGVADYSTRPDEGKAFHYKLRDGDIVEKKSWSGLESPGGGGTRIYVLEGGGAVLAKQGGLVYFLHESFSEGDVSSMPNISFQIPNAQPSDRACAVSYIKKGKKTIGIGYGQGWFIEVPQNPEPPYAPDFANATSPKQVHDKLWGYSCFIDSRRLVYYGQYVRGAYGIQAIALDTLTSVDPKSIAPNANFISNNTPEIAKSVNLTANVPGQSSTGSYAMAGDLQGNIYNGEKYTVTHESLTNTLWASDLTGTNLTIYPHKCGSTQATCVGHKIFTLQELGLTSGVQPLSALGEGFVIGLTRNPANTRAKAEVYLLSLKDKKNISVGVDVKRLDTLQNADPYMYTDFTGATLYKSSTRNEIDLTKTSSWKDGFVVKTLSFIYTSDSKESISWQNIKAEIRCYLDKSAKPEFEEVDLKTEPLVQKRVDASSCSGKEIKYVEVRFQAVDSTPDLNYISEIQITAFQ